MSLWEDNKGLLFKEVSGNSCVHCTEGIVQEVDIGIVVEDPCQVYPRLLPPTQGHTSLSHQCQITIHKLSNILEGDGEETGRGWGGYNSTEVRSKSLYCTFRHNAHDL